MSIKAYLDQSNTLNAPGARRAARNAARRCSAIPAGQRPT